MHEILFFIYEIHAGLGHLARFFES